MRCVRARSTYCQPALYGGCRRDGNLSDGISCHKRHQQASEDGHPLGVGSLQERSGQPEYRYRSYLVATVSIARRYCFLT